MNDNNEQLIDSEISRPGSESGAPSAGETPTAALAPAKRGQGLAMLALLVGAAGLGGAAWLWWQQQSLNHSLREQVAARSELAEGLDTQARQQQRLLEAQIAERAELTERVQKLEAQRERLSRELTAMDEKLAAQTARQPLTWPLAEAEHLLRLAAIRLGERDTASAIRLLSDADGRVRDLPEAGALRAAIARDLAELRTAPSVDVTGLLLRIEALLPKLAQLPTPKPLEPALSAEEKIQAELQSEWQKNLSALWVTLRRDWIEVRHHSGATPELELPAVRSYLDQNLALALQQAEWAVSRGDEALYQGALSRAEAWSRRHLDNEAEATRHFLQALAELKATPIAPPSLNIDGSLTAARDLLARQMQPAPAQSPAPEDDEPSGTAPQAGDSA